MNLAALRDSSPARADGVLAKENGWTITAATDYSLSCERDDVTIEVEYSRASNGVLSGSISSTDYRAFLTGTPGRDRAALKTALTADRD